MKKDEYILICEDSEFVLQIARFALEAEGFNVDTATSTDALFNKLKNNNKPSLILLDLNIPEAGGESVINQLRRQDETKDIPVILFSGEENLSETASRLKVDGFLNKPFNNSDLTAIAAKFMHSKVK